MDPYMRAFEEGLLAGLAVTLLAMWRLADPDGSRIGSVFAAALLGCFVVSFAVYLWRERRKPRQKQVG